MLAVYDETEILRDYIEGELREATAKATEETARETTERVEKDTAKNMLREGLSIEQVIRCLPGLTVEDVQEIQRQMHQAE
ncbi:MAG: hypothetical protein MR316_05235 [Lachnospiraceae bacterium]|nr:hypothetical protein [Lachnospiraceae bacterium]